MSVGSRIKNLREKRNLSRSTFAKRLGVTVGAVSNYENGVSSPKEPILFKIMEVLDCDANYIFQDSMKHSIYKDDATPEEFENIIKKYRLLDPHGTEMVDYVLKSEYDRCQVKEEQSIYTVSKEQQNMRTLQYYQKLASAGTGQVVFDDIPIDSIRIPDIPEYRCVSYAIGVNGDSMEPLYYDGDILLVETTLQIEIGEIGIFIVDGEAYVKQLGDGKLISLNEKYKDIPLTEYSQCMGKVVDKLEEH